MCEKSVLYTAFDVVPSPKGASTHITYFVKGLVEAGYDVQLITAGDPSLPAEDTYHGARLKRVISQETNFLRRAMSFSEAVTGHLADGHGYTVAHFRSIWSGYPLVQAREQHGYRTLFEVNGLPSIELKYHYPALKGAPVLNKIKHQEVATLHLADHIICPSRVTREYITSLGIPPERVTVIPNGVDTARFSPCPAPPDEVPLLLYIGTLAGWQGLDTLLEAMPLVLAEHPARLNIVGKGRKEQRKSLQKRIRKMGLAGWVSLEGSLSHDTIPKMINQAHLCLAPLSFNDRNVTQGCCPIKVLEYLACDKPLVAANLPVVRELVCDGQEALLFTPDDPADLARCILTLLNDPPLAERLAEAGCQRVRREFTWEIAQQKLLGVYERLLEAEG
ncbi:MAG: glycosyltransferase [Anaerolineae bacterium]|nr:glycosyltransferase [Anaerolineae bacterium]